MLRLDNDTVVLSSSDEILISIFESRGGCPRTLPSGCRSFLAIKREDIWGSFLGEAKLLLPGIHVKSSIEAKIGGTKNMYSSKIAALTTGF